MIPIDWLELLDQARAVRLRAHAPYSGYLVGAALLTDSGRVFVGCNVENASLGLTVCAERAAVVHMVCAGETSPLALGLVSAGPAIAMPCGMCRQTLREFAPDLAIRAAHADDLTKAIETSLAELLPKAFDARMLANTR